VPRGRARHLNGPAHRQGGYGAASAATRLSVAGRRPIVVVGRSRHRLRGAAGLIEHRAATHPVVAVEMGWPSSHWRPAGVRAFVTTYGASRANGWAAAAALGLLPQH